MQFPMDLGDLDAAEITELIVQQDAYTRMLNQCWSKCVNKFGEPDLTVGEGACTERCTRKWMASQKLMEKTLYGLDATKKREESRNEKLRKRAGQESQGL